MYTVVACLTVVVAFVKATENTEKTTGFASGAAELCIRTHFDDYVIELSVQVLVRRMVSLKSLQIRIQPESDMVYPEVNQSIDV